MKAHNHAWKKRLKGLFAWKEEDPRRRNNFTLGLHAEISVRVVPKKRRFSTELKMARDKNKNAIWAPLLSLLGLISSRRGDQDTKARNAFIHRACLTLRALFALAFARRLKNAKKYNVSSHPVIPNIFHLNFTVIKPLKMKHDVNYWLQPELENTIDLICLAPGGYSWEFLVGCADRFFRSCPYFRPKNIIFYRQFLDLASTIRTRFQTWRRSQNASLHVQIKQKLCHHCWD